MKTNIQFARVAILSGALLTGACVHNQDQPVVEEINATATPALSVEQINTRTSAKVEEIQADSNARVAEIEAETKDYLRRSLLNNVIAYMQDSDQDPALRSHFYKNLFTQLQNAIDEGIITRADADNITMEEMQESFASIEQKGRSYQIKLEGWQTDENGNRFYGITLQ